MERGGTGKRAERLRERARRHETVRRLTDELPELEAGSTTPEPGLYVDLDAGESTVEEGELRLPVARVVSSDGRRSLEVGRVVAVSHLDDPLERWTARLVVEVPGSSSSVATTDEATWFLRVLEVHYREAGAPLDIGATVDA